MTQSEVRSEIYNEISAERSRQDAKWGNQFNHPDYFWALILGEEFGEIQKSILENDFENLRVELIQVAAVAVQWLEAIQARDPKEMKM